MVQGIDLSNPCAQIVPKVYKYTQKYNIFLMSEKKIRDQGDPVSLIPPASPSCLRVPHSQYRVLPIVRDLAAITPVSLKTTSPTTSFISARISNTSTQLLSTSCYMISYISLQTGSAKMYPEFLILFTPNVLENWFPNTSSL